MPSRTTQCTAATREGRMAKAMQFLDAAETVEALADDSNDVADAFVTLCVHAGIAAATSSAASGWVSTPVERTTPRQSRFTAAPAKRLPRICGTCSA